MIQFYAPDILQANELPESESAHCCRVLRLKEGDEIVVTDGKGGRFKCEILNAHPSHTQFLIKEEISIKSEKNYTLTLAVAPTKNADRMEWMVEKAVEIGVDRIVLLKCKRSERKVMRRERLQKVMIAAMKQSLGTFLPELEELIDFKSFINNIRKDTQKFFGYCSEKYPRKEFANELRQGGDVVVMIGPEGDFTEEEVAEAVNAGFIPVTFGEKRLRTETAGVYAVCAVSVLNQIYRLK